MPYDPNLATIEANKLISDVNETAGTQLRFVTAADINRAVADPRGVTSLLVSQINGTPNDQISAAVELVAGNRSNLEATIQTIRTDLDNSPNLKAAFDDASQRVSTNDFIRLVSPLSSKLGLPTSSGATIFNLVTSNLDLIPIKF
jgi:hypothetical protein